MAFKLPIQTEYSLHRQVAEYLRRQYPSVIFRTDGAGLRLPMGLAVKFAALQNGMAYPDLFIAERNLMFQSDKHLKDESNLPVIYSGMFLELKRPGEQVKRTKDANKIKKGEKKLRLAGDWWDDHVEAQAKCLELLRAKGYYAEFATGFSEAKEKIDWYLKK